jgi:DNA-binding CsgD family transcriptional regulator
VETMARSTAELQSHGGYRQYLANPCAMAGTRLDPIVALGCVLILAAIFLLEAITPDDVVGALALLPLVAGAWMLSNRMAGVVIAAGVLIFTAAVLLETGNRTTVVLVGIPVLFTAGLVRLCAANLSAAMVGDGEQIFLAVAAPAFAADPFDDGRASPSLTRRELEVARLAARAYTAAEIGQTLHIGERTVESHIASTYLKLGIRSRSELIRIASKLR